jgi:hypothetical protein
MTDDAKQMRTLIRTQIKDQKEQEELVQTKDILDKDFLMAKGPVFSLILYLGQMNSSTSTVAQRAIFGEIESL